MNDYELYEKFAYDLYGYENVRILISEEDLKNYPTQNVFGNGFIIMLNDTDSHMITYNYYNIMSRQLLADEILGDESPFYFKVKYMDRFCWDMKVCVATSLLDDIQIVRSLYDITNSLNLVYMGIHDDDLFIANDINLDITRKYSDVCAKLDGHKNAYNMSKLLKNEWVHNMHLGVMDISDKLDYCQHITS